jgi:hypothetical protein
MIAFSEKISYPFLDLRKRTLHLQSQTDGAIAQSVEQRTENPCVPGSNPGGTTSKSLSAMKGFFGFYEILQAYSFDV